MKISEKEARVKKNEATQKKNSSGGGARMLMFMSAIILILYLRQFTCDRTNVSMDDLHVIYSLYTCILLLLCGCSLPPLL